jgi:hypothetical protein
VNLRSSYRSEIFGIPQCRVADVNDCHESILALIVLGLLSGCFRHDDHIG